MDLDLNGRVAIVTGASKGIGLAVVGTLVEEGARVVATSRNRGDELGADVVHVPADLMDPDAPAEVIARAIDAFGRAAIPAMLERGGGAIVNVSSVHGRQPSAVNVDYGAAKAAMINLGGLRSRRRSPTRSRSWCRRTRPARPAPRSWSTPG
jgi:NAD(P)-dependent dehydrogenase (short-subunit alcohol dehydrogenase family)